MSQAAPVSVASREFGSFSFPLKRGNERDSVALLWQPAAHFPLPVLGR
jgi:hypothetical protein